MTKIEQDAMEAVKGIYREVRKKNEVDWEQRRYETAKDVLVGLLSNPKVHVGELTTSIVIGVSVQVAELLVAELQKD